MNKHKYQPYLIPGQLDIITGSAGLPVVRICTSAATAEICLLGAHIMSYTPRGERDLLWMSSKSAFAEGKALRGGIPICWPWFGAPPEGASTSHGYVRYRLWELTDSRVITPDCIEAIFTCPTDKYAPSAWPYSSRLELLVRVGRKLELELTTFNSDKVPFTINQALHTYYNISDIRDIRIQGFQGLTYHNTVNKDKVTYCQQQGDITFSAETDAVFVDCPNTATIYDPIFLRKIHIEKENSASAVVWNPWAGKAKQMTDFGDEEYKSMVCVECCNIRSDARTILPQNSHTLKTSIYSSPLSAAEK